MHRVPVGRLSPSTVNRCTTRYRPDCGVVAVSIFVSYSRKDSALVQGLTTDLSRAQIDVWLDQEFRGGVPWWQEVLRQIRKCDAFLLALSMNSLKSKPCL